MNARAQTVFEDWVATKGFQDLYLYGKAVTDGAGNVYQAGATLNDTGNYDALVTKYDRNGVELWSQLISTTGDETFTDIVLGASGKLFLTGASRAANQASSTVLTARLSQSTGAIEWTQFYSYTSSIFNLGASLVRDASNNVYVTGFTQNLSTLGDVLVLKYNTAGTLQWGVKSDVYGLDDAAVKAALNGTKLTVSGAAQNGQTSWRYLTQVYNTANGSLTNSAVGANNVTSIDQVQDLVVDASDNIYITGTAGTATQGYNMYTVKMDDALNVLWQQSYNYAGSGNDKAFGMALDNSGNVIVTGCTSVNSTNTQFTTIKYTSGGVQSWVRHYDVSTARDTAHAVTTDGSGNVYVSGTFSNGSNRDVKTLKYDAAGNLKWEIDYNGVNNGDDYVLDITRDALGGIVLVTQARTATDYEYASVRYVESTYEDLSFTPSESAFANAFIKNLGQLRDENGTAQPDVKFHSKQGAYYSFYRDGAMEWMTRTHHNDSTMADTLQKLTLSFVSPEPNCRVYTDKRSEYFENYYYPYGTQKLERIPFYEKLIYPEIWEDLALETALLSGQELRFTIDTKGKTSDIKINVAGADSVRKNADGTVALYTFNGAITLLKAKAYQENGLGVLIELGWTPALKVIGNQISLDSIGTYNSTKKLIIRLFRGGDIPQADGFCHSTYFGGTSEDRIWNATTDNNGWPITCGTTGNIGYFVQQGITVVNPSGTLFNALQGFVVKFDRDFVPRFMTIVHGSDNLLLTAVGTRSNGDIYASGFTSAGNLLTPNIIGAGYQDNSYGGARDGYIMRLNGVNGQVQWATYFGGSNPGIGSFSVDEIYDLAVDSQDRLYIVGVTPNTSTGFPYTNLSGAYNETGLSDNTGFIARFKSDLTLEWCTQFGGNGKDIVRSISIGPDDHFVIGGETRSSTLSIPLFPGTVQDLSLNGASDWFIATFNADAQLLWGTLEGSSGEEIGFESWHTVAMDNSGAVYFSGSAANFTGLNLVNPGGGVYFNNTDSGNSASGNKYGFVVKFNPATYQPVWRTLLMDGTGWLRVSSLDVQANKLIIGGFTEDISMPLVSASSSIYSEDIVIGNFPGFTLQSDGYLMIFEKNSLDLLHSTYFGGEDHTWPREALRAVKMNQFNELFAFGHTRSRYIAGDEIGIPVFDNGIENAWFQPNLTNFQINNPDVDGFMFKLCFDGTILNTAGRVIDKSDGHLEVYPNPVSQNSHALQVVLRSPQALIGDITIYSVDGKRMYGETDVLLLKQEPYSINLPPNLLSGVYVIELRTSSETFSSKFVKE